MPVLILKFKDNVLGEYHIPKDGSLTIGRKEANQVVIENLAVSGHHAKIDSVGEGYLLTDLKSKNGTYINRDTVASHWLQHGDEILIGKHTLKFQYTADEKRPPSPGSMEQTMVMESEKYRQLLANAAGGTEGPTGMLSFIAGGQGEVELTQKLTRIGKSKSCDIVLSGFWIGQTACTISKRPQGYTLSYVEGIAKPKVNGKAVKTTVELKEFDRIEIGSAKMDFLVKN